MNREPDNREPVSQREKKDRSDIRGSIGITGLRVHGITIHD